MQARQHAYENRKISGKQHEYFLQEHLQSGNTGSVYRGTIANSGYEVAVKVKSKSVIDQSESLKKIYFNEVHFLGVIRSPNVIQLLETIEVQGDQGTHYVTVFPFCKGGSLKDDIARQPGQCYDQVQAIAYFMQLVNGLSALHRQNIAHRALKPEKIFLDGETVKLGSLGFSKMVGESGIASTSLPASFTTPPELLESREQYNAYQADVYSAGVILYFMLYGDYPFKGGTAMAISRKIKQKDFTVDLAQKNVTEDIKQLLTRMLEYDTAKRITFREIFQHQIFQRIATQIASGKLHWSQLSCFEIDSEGNSKLQQYAYEPGANVPALGDQGVQSLPAVAQGSVAVGGNAAPVGNQELTTIKNNARRRAEITTEVERVLQFYRNDINLYDEFAQAVYQESLLDDYVTSPVDAMALLLRRLIAEYEALLLEITQTRTNRHNCGYPEFLYECDKMRNIAAAMRERMETCTVYKQYLLSELHSKYGDDDGNENATIAAFQDAKWTPQSVRVYRAMLGEYVNQLHYEILQRTPAETPKNVIFQKFILLVMDCALFEQVYRTQPIFDFEQHTQRYANMTYQERKTQIETRMNELSVVLTAQ